VITCLVTNWGITVALGLLLTMSEWLAKTKRFEENGLLDLTNHFLKTVLKHKGDKK
jgi:spore maturation protein SpmB